MDRPSWLKTSFLINTHCEHARCGGSGCGIHEQAMMVDRWEDALMLEETQAVKLPQWEQLRSVKQMETGVEGEQPGQGHSQGASQGQDNVIVFAAAETDSSWITDQDSHELQDTSEEQHPQSGELERDIIRLIQTEGIEWPIPDWLSKPRPQSIQLLVDEIFHYWPHPDRKCIINLEEWNLKRWTQEIRSNRITIRTPIIVCALATILQVQGLEPLKNALAAMCRAIRSQSPHCRIFFANNLTRPGHAPVLQARMTAHNDLLFRAITGINIKLGRVFYMGMDEHLTVKRAPQCEYFNNQQLSKFRCQIYMYVSRGRSHGLSSINIGCGTQCPTLSREATRCASRLGGIAYGKQLIEKTFNEFIKYHIY